MKWQDRQTKVDLKYGVWFLKPERAWIPDIKNSENLQKKKKGGGDTTQQDDFSEKLFLI